MSAKKLTNGGLSTVEMILGRKLGAPAPIYRLVRRSDKTSTWEEWQKVPILGQGNSRPRKAKSQIVG